MIGQFLRTDVPPCSTLLKLSVQKQDKSNPDESFSKSHVFVFLYHEQSQRKTDFHKNTLAQPCILACDWLLIKCCLRAHGTWITFEPYTHTNTHKHTTFAQQSLSAMETSMPGLLHHHHHHHTQSGLHLLQLRLCVWARVCVSVFLQPSARMGMRVFICELELGFAWWPRSLRKWWRVPHTKTSPTAVELCCTFADKTK